MLYEEMGVIWVGGWIKSDRVGFQDFLYEYELQHGLVWCRVLQHVQLETKTEQERKCSTDKEHARVG